MDDLRHKLMQLNESQRRTLASRLDQEVANPGRSRTELAACVVVHDGHDVTDVELRNQLKQRLPEYMIPPVISFFDAIPRTTNGKVDRNALREMEVHCSVDDESTGSDKFVAPRSPVEKKLATIWGDVLGFETIGTRDNFFEVGGDSLLSIRIIARALEAGLRITPEQLVESPTIEALAATAAITGSNESLGDDNQRVENIAARAENLKPREFPLADLDQDELDRISGLIKKIDNKGN